MPVRARVSETAMAALLVLIVSQVNAQQGFRRGDANADGVVDIADAEYVVNFNFLGGPEFPCWDAADVNHDGEVKGPGAIGDIAYLLEFLYRGGPPPPPPGPFECGPQKDPITPVGCPSYPPGCEAPREPDPDPDFTLYFENDPDTAAFATFAMLQNARPAWGWNLRIRSSCPIVHADIASMVLEQVNGKAEFFHVRTIDAADGTGAFGIESAVVPKLTEKSPFVPEGGPYRILRIELHPSEPGFETQCVLEYDDELNPECPAPDPGNSCERPFRKNRISSGGVSVRPLTIPGVLELPSPCGDGTVLTVGMPQKFELRRGAESQCFRTEVFPSDEPGQALILRLEDANPKNANALYAKWGAPASPTDFDYAADDLRFASQELLIPELRADELHVYVRGVKQPEGQATLILHSALIDTALLSVAPAFSAEGSVVHAVVQGAGFDDDTDFTIVHGSLPAQVPAEELRILSSSLATVVFDLGAHSAPLGLYNLTATQGPFGGLDPTIAVDKFEVKPAELGPRVQTEIHALPFYRPQRVGRVTLEYTNLGDRELPAKLYKVTGPEPLAAGANPRMRMWLDGEPPGTREHVLVLGVQRGGVPSYLPPGSSTSVPVLFRSEDSTPEGETELFRVFEFQPPADGASSGNIDWDALPPPSGMNAVDWDAARPGLEAALGTTWTEYCANLLDIANRLALRGGDPTSARHAFRFAVRGALGRNSSAVIGKVRDAFGAPVEGASVVALREGDARATTTTDEGGNFTLDFLEGGATYEIVVMNFDVGLHMMTPDDGEDIVGVDLEATPAANGITPACPDCDEAGLPEIALEPPTELFAIVADDDTNIITSIDPNSKQGPVGGEGGLIDPKGPDEPENRKRTVTSDERLDYTIHFENLPAALAAAQTVEIVDELEEDLNEASLRFNEVGFGDHVINLDVPVGSILFGLGSFSGGGSQLSVTEEIDVTIPSFMVGGDTVPSLDLTVRVTAELDVSPSLPNPRVTWLFESFDALTGEEPIDPRGGFLPPENGAGLGQGFATFSIDSGDDGMMPEDDTELGNRADIVFDTNASISTNLERHFIDDGLLPDPPENPCPAHETIDVPVDRILSWEPHERAQSYEVYLWRPSSEPKPTSPTAATGGLASYLPPLPLDLDETYNWQIVSLRNGERVDGPEWTFETDASLRFLRADCDGDGSVVGSVTDAVFNLQFNFTGGPTPPCLAACDSDGDGTVVGTVTDSVYTLLFNFVGGPAPVAPWPLCGAGELPTDVLLGCEAPRTDC